MGAVYLGRDMSSGQPVAIKHLRPELVASDPEMVERFAREVIEPLSQDEKEI